jgi:hypothetical protein
MDPIERCHVLDLSLLDLPGPCHPTPTVTWSGSRKFKRAQHIQLKRTLALAPDQVPGQPILIVLSSNNSITVMMMMIASHPIR